MKLVNPIEERKAGKEIAIRTTREANNMNVHQEAELNFYRRL